MKKQQQRILTGLAGATMILSSAAAQADEAVFQSNAPAYTVAEGETVSYRRVANVQGGFRFDQNCLTPTDDVFSLFGTVLTGACAKPAFAFENQQAEDHYINVGGKIRKAYSINLKDAKETEQVSLCACATGSATANVKITGVLLSDVLTLADMDADVNTLKIIGSDGYGTKVPLSCALEKKAMIVYRINDENIPSGTQFWLPATVAKYFTRDVVDVELLAEKETPFRSLFDPDDDRFMPQGDMPARIAEYCRETDQPVPVTRPQFARAIYESLALKYRWAINRLERDILGEKIDCLHIVGGGSNNVLLNRMTASSIDRPVLAGPGEGTAIGNLLMQAMALGAIRDLDELREVVRNSFEVRAFQPEKDADWDAAYAKFLRVTGLED